jgi:hypothetical protein
MTPQQEKDLLGRLDEITDALIELNTFLVESGLKESLRSIAESLKERD